jgi:hypothetical protein
MKNLRHFEKLYNSLLAYRKECDTETETIIVYNETIEEIETILPQITKVSGGIEFSLNDLEYCLFFDEIEFKQKWRKAVNSKKDIAILNFGSIPKYYSIEKKICYNNFSADDSFYFKNLFAYRDFIDFFISKSNGDYSDFQFVDNFDENSRKLFFTSSKEPGKLVISYPVELPNFDDTINYSNILIKLISSFEPVNKHLPLFIKNEIFKYFNNKNDCTGFVTLFINLKSILALANKNYQIYLHDLSLDKIKTDYKDYKQKYFSSQNEILSKITTQVIALPISIAASAFSLYGLKGEIIPTLIVLFGIVSYIVYVTFILSIYFSDIINLNKLAQKDYNTLKIHPFFLVYIDELSFFNNIKDDLFNRLKSLKMGLNIFTFIMWISSTSLVFFSLKMLSININILIFPFLIISFLFCYIYMNFLNKEELKNE